MRCGGGGGGGSARCAGQGRARRLPVPADAAGQAEWHREPQPVPARRTELLRRRLAGPRPYRAGPGPTAAAQRGQPGAEFTAWALAAPAAYPCRLPACRRTAGPRCTRCCGGHRVGATAGAAAWPSLPGTPAAGRGADRQSTQPAGLWPGRRGRRGPVESGGGGA
ncbi:hypothetical protein G6F35_016057 [Rhizopus arrhizus]|nr:hypothetical protein G6F35_016057 [Rhizopus arrhizus]